jgi:hypothetical protein
MSNNFKRILRARGEYFSGFAAALRESLQDRGIEPTDDALINVAVQLYAIEPDESEIYADPEEETDEEEW